MLAAISSSSPALALGRRKWSRGAWCTYSRPVQAEGCASFHRERRSDLATHLLAMQRVDTEQIPRHAMSHHPCWSGGDLEPRLDRPVCRQSLSGSTLGENRRSPPT